MLTKTEQPARLYLEDFSVGQTFRSGSRRITEAEIKTFAKEYDPQPFHLDEAAAKATMFGGLAASGAPRPNTSGTSRYSSRAPVP